MQLPVESSIAQLTAVSVGQVKSKDVPCSDDTHYVSNQVLNGVKQSKRQKNVTNHIILSGLTNAICWIPFSIFYLVSIFNIKSPIALFYWIILIALPINAMINPVIFHLSKIRRKTCFKN